MKNHYNDLVEGQNPDACGYDLRYKYIKDIEPISDIKCFARMNVSPNGKIWRKVFLQRNPKVGDKWEMVGDIKKSPSWRGAFKTAFYSVNRYQGYSQTVEEAERFLEVIGKDFYK